VIGHKTNKGPEAEIHLRQGKKKSAACKKPPRRHGSYSLGRQGDTFGLADNLREGRKLHRPRHDQKKETGAEALPCRRARPPQEGKKKKLTEGEYICVILEIRH